jgi:hypothetical protein
MTGRVEGRDPAPHPGFTWAIRGGYDTHTVWLATLQEEHSFATRALTTAVPPTGY